MPRNATTGVLTCCACTASGQAAAVPQRSVMNSRLRIAFPNLQHHANRAIQLREQSRKLGLAECAINDQSAPQQDSRYSITSSARLSSEDGSGRPRALAVVMFTSRSNLVGCSTG